MIEAILRHNAGLLPVFLLSALLLGAAGRWLAPRGARGRAVLFAVALAGELTATLYPTERGGPASQVCSYSKDLLSAFGTEQGLLNLALFVPPALTATLLFRRPLEVLAGCWLLSATTETAQALLPGIGRACDSQDFVTNAVGALLGVAAATAWQLRRGNQTRPTSGNLVRGGMPLTVGAVVLLAVQLGAVRPQWTDGGLTPVTSPAKRALAVRAAEAVFGSGIEVVNVQDEAPIGQDPELLIVTTRHQRLCVEWPSGALSSGMTAVLAPQTPGGSDPEARRAADTFARSWFPQELTGTSVVVREDGPARRTVQYRHLRADGRPEPRSLTVTVDPGGRIAEFEAHGPTEPQPGSSAVATAPTGSEP